MEKLEYKIDISADHQKVWKTMLGPETYKEWVSPSWPGSYYDGKWEEGQNINFISPGQGGTKATLREIKPYKYLSAEHIAVINPDHSEDRESEVAKGWIGTTESYSFVEKDGKTELKVEINTTPGWKKMFDEGWPSALAKLKEMCEN